MLNEKFISDIPSSEYQQFVDGYSRASKMRNSGKGGFQAEIGKPGFFSSLWRKARKQAIAQNPIVPNMADYVNWVLYDRAVFAAAANVPVNFKLFTVPIGTNNKTKVDTNLDQVSQLPQPYWMNVTQLGFYFYPNILQTDLYAFMAQSYFEFWVNNKVYVEGPYQAFPGGAGVFGFDNIAATSGLANGYPMVGNMFDLRLPAGINLGGDSQGGAVITDGITGINILQSQTFKVENNLPGGALALTAGGGGGTGLTLQAFAIGILSRSVQ